MPPSTSKFRVLSRLAWLLFACVFTPGVMFAGGGDSLLFEVTRESDYLNGCYPPCRCALSLTPGVTGTFLMEFERSDPLFRHYRVRDVDWTVPGDPPKRVRGSGTYRVGGEVASMQQLVLDLSIDGAEIERFDSGLIEGGSAFPSEMDITISINGMVCLDTVFSLQVRGRVSETVFVRGDCNGDGNQDISDGVASLIALFAGEGPVECEDACDANDDGQHDISDAIYYLSALFLGGEAPPAPFPTCGSDPDGDELTCRRYAPCSNDCLDEMRAIASESDIEGSTSAIVRLDYETRSILGWQLVQGAYRDVTETDARRQAQSDTGYGEAGRMLNDESPGDVYVFYESPGDFGGAAVVSARSGLTLFGGSIIWDGRGDIRHPKSWRPADTLGSGCDRISDDVPIAAYDLLGGVASLDPEQIQEIIEIVWGTALPAGLSESKRLSGVTLIRYPRTVGAFDPSSAEWIVMLHAGSTDGD